MNRTEEHGLAPQRFRKPWRNPDDVPTYPETSSAMGMTRPQGELTTC
jgi:hypothetical protein